MHAAKLTVLESEGWDATPILTLCLAANIREKLSTENDSDGTANVRVCGHRRQPPSPPKSLTLTSDTLRRILHYLCFQVKQGRSTMDLSMLYHKAIVAIVCLLSELHDLC